MASRRRARVVSVAACAASLAVTSLLAAGSAQAAKGVGGSKPGGGASTSGVPNLVVSTAWVAGAAPTKCEPILGGCTTQDGRLTLVWVKSGSPVTAGMDLPATFTIRNAGTASSAATSGTFSFDRTGESRSGSEEFRLKSLSVVGTKTTSGTISGTRGETASFSVPGLAAGASVTVQVTYTLLGVAGASITGTGTATRTSVGVVTGESSTGDNVLATSAGAYNGQG